MKTTRLESPVAMARLTGFLYLVIMVSAMFAEGFVLNNMVVSHDAAATFKKIATHDSLWRWGMVADIVTTLSDIAVAALLYVLLKPVARTLSVNAGFFRLAYSALMAGAAAFLVIPLALIKDAAGKSGEALSQAQSLVLFAVKMHAVAFEVGLVLFGVHLVLIGILIARSTFLPRILGVMLGFAGLCYVTNSLLGFIAPALADVLFPWILLPGFVAEGALTLWLLIMGVHRERWLAAA